MIRKKKKKEKPLQEQEVKYTLKELEDSMPIKRKNFCHYYIREWNKTRSYKDAYGHHLSDSVAVCSAIQILRNIKVKQYIEYIQKDIAKEVGISKIKCLDRLKKIAFAEIPDMYEDWVTRKELATIKENNLDISAALQEVSTKIVNKTDPLSGEPYTEEYVKVKLHCPQRAIESIFKAMGWNDPEKINLTIEQPLFPDIKY